MKEKVFILLSGANLADLRQKRGLRQEDLAERIGISRPTIVTWEGKDKFKIDEDKLERLLSALNVTVNDLTMTVSTKKEGDILDNPLVKSYVSQIESLNKLVDILERENKELRGGKK